MARGSPFAKCCWLWLSILWALWGIPFTSVKAAETIPGIEAEIAFRSLYAKEKGHKALVVAPAGEWDMVSNQASASTAQREALRRCNKGLRQTPWGRESECEIFAVDHEIVWPKPLLGPPLGEALPPPDIPLSKSHQFRPDDLKIRGFVLALHGCGKPWRGPHPFAVSWFDFFRARGLHVFYPNSYHDPTMPEEKCGWADPSRDRGATEANKVRIAQAKRSIAELRKRDPKLPIYIWAHSGGGNIAQSLDDDLTGIFILGTKCGVGLPQVELVRPNVPMMFIFGEDDEYLLRAHKKITPKLVNKQCGSYYRTKSRKWVLSMKGTHLTTIWRQNIVDAVASILEQGSFQLKASPARGTIDGEAKRAFEREYRFLPVKKAFAVGPEGAFGFVASWEGQEDAIQNALYECARRLRGSHAVVSYKEGGTQPCQIYAIGDKIVAKP